MVLHSKSGDLRFIHLLPSPARGPDPGRAVGSEAVLGIGGVFARAGVRWTSAELPESRYQRRARRHTRLAVDQGEAWTLGG